MCEPDVEGGEAKRQGSIQHKDDLGGRMAFRIPFLVLAVFFVTDVRPKIIAENPEVTLAEVDRELGYARELEAQWAKLSDAEIWGLVKRGWT